MTPWWQFALYGAIGGGLAESLAIANDLFAWQRARRTANGRVSTRRPRVRIYFDGPAHLWVGLARVILGGIAGGLFGHAGSINGPAITVVLGFAAPSVLKQLGEVSQVAALIGGEAEFASGDSSQGGPTKVSGSQSANQKGVGK